MAVNGKARKGKRTKDLIKHLTSSDIAIIDHADLDRVSADALVRSGVKGVINASRSITGDYPNVGPQILAQAGVVLLDNVGPEIFDIVTDRDLICIDDDMVICNNMVVATGITLTEAAIERQMADAEHMMSQQLEKFVENTIDYLDKQKADLIYDTWVPDTETDIQGRQVLVVVRGYDYRQDLRTLTPYISEIKPVLIGVDGGADAILEAGFKPDIIIGDMDSVTDEALLSGAEVIPHAYEDGNCAALEHLTDDLGLKVTPWPLSATSEDLALLLAWEKKADLIVALGTHSNLIEYLDKGRSGMASSFLVRLKVGTKLVDAKGVSKLYRASPSSWQLVLPMLAALAVVIAVIYISSPLRDIFTVMWLNARTHLGF